MLLRNKSLSACFILLLVLGISPLYAIEKAEGITDRELIKTLLVELKEGLKQTNQRIENMQKSVNQRFDQMQKSNDQRFDQINQRFDQMQKSNDQQFGQKRKGSDRQFDQVLKSINQRFDYLRNLTLIVIAGIYGLIAYIVWDRITAFRRLEKKNGLS